MKKSINDNWFQRLEGKIFSRYGHFLMALFCGILFSGVFYAIDITWREGFYVVIFLLTAMFYFAFKYFDSKDKIKKLEEELREKNESNE